MNGIIVLNKQKGMTSNQAVMKVKHLLKEKHVGHTGTLDPEVTGVLPIVIGKATKLVSLMDNDKKVYEATILIGKRSDTLDAFGTILESEIVNELEDPTPFLHSFLGTYMQIPPMFSALHYEGKRMYELAREKIEVPR